MIKCLINIMDGMEEDNGVMIYMQMIDSKIIYIYQIFY